MKRIMLWSAGFVLCAGVVGAQTAISTGQRTGAPHGPVNTGAVAPEDEAPARLLQAMRSQFHPKVARYLGVAAPEDIDSTEVGRVIQTYQLSLPDLQAYAGAEDALSGPFSITRLVTVRGEVRAAIDLVKDGDRWEISRVGAANRAAAIERVTAALVAERGIAADATFLVQAPVPGLRMEFVGFGAGAAIELAPLYDAPEAGLTAGEALPADAALAPLVSIAENSAVN
jgi:hypothetical protein